MIRKVDNKHSSKGLCLFSFQKRLAEGDVNFPYTLAMFEYIVGLEVPL